MWHIRIRYNSIKRRWDMYRLFRGKEHFVMDFPCCDNFIRLFKDVREDKNKYFDYKLIVEYVE